MTIRNECEYFLIALAFFSRIPVPAWVDFSPDKLSRACRYYALVGFVIGLLTSVVFSLAHLFFSVPVSVLISMFFSVYLTGAFHEDGFADCCDGFGGGYSTEKKLEIMKDSRVGTYGVVGLVLILLLKWQLLTELDLHIPLALILAHTLSRQLAGSLTFGLSYVRKKESKIKSFVQEVHRCDFAVLLLSGFLLTSLFLPFFQSLILLLLILVMKFLASLYLRRVLGGYTGDCLGAAQQLSEIVFYLVFLSYF